jgi:hypothetical protein
MSLRSLLRPLRPVLIAGAAAVAWLSFSAPAADASTEQGQDSLLGGITAPATSAGSGTNDLGITARALKVIDTVAPAGQPDVSAVPVLAPPSQAVPAGAMPAPAAAAEYAPSLVRGIIAPVEAAAHTLTSSEVLPAHVAAPVASLANTAVERVAETVSQTVVAPAVEAAPVLAPPLESVSDVVKRAPSLVESVAPVPEVLEEADSAAAADVAEALHVTPNSGSSDEAEGATQSAAPTANTAAGDAEDAGIRDELSSADSILRGASGPAMAAQSLLALSGNGRTPAEGDDRPGPLLPAFPSGSGSGNGQSSGGPFASAAWLAGSFENLPPAGLLAVRGLLQHIPSSIALEPGSSPD